MDKVNSERLSKEDYDKSCEEMANYLLGKILVRKLDTGELLKGKIVETECYLGGEDKASHSYNGKITKRNKAMYMPPGTAYVYTIYFGYHCLNISSKEPGAAVLIRSLQVVAGRDTMQNFRESKLKNVNRRITPKDLCNGPSKLCIAMNITKENSNELDLSEPKNNEIWLEDPSIVDEEITIVNTSRIGLGPSAMEWVTKPLRYYILNNKCVSKRNKQAEKILEFSH